MKDADKLWASLPLPALLIGADDRIEAVNPAAEQLLMGSEKSLAGKPLFEAVSFENALNEAFERARREDAPLFCTRCRTGAIWSCSRAVRFTACAL